MKTKLKRVGKSALSSVLCVMMVISTMLIGTFTTNATITGEIYFDNSETNWSSVYAFVGHGSWTKSYAMTEDSDGIWKTSANFSSEWDDATSLFFASSAGNVSSGSGTDIYSSPSTLGISSASYTANTATITDGTTNYCYVPDSTSTGTSLSIMTVSDAIARHSSKVATPTIASVLSGSKVSFYYGDSWSSGTKYLRTSTTTSANSDIGYSYFNVNSNYLRAYTGTSTAYYVSNTDSWNGNQMSSAAQAGYMYINGSLSSPSTSKSGASFSSSTYTVTAGTTSSGISATLDSTTSVAGYTNKITYYYTTDNSTFYELDVDAVSSLAEGTYTIYALVSDGYIYVNADSATLTVEEAGTKLNQPTITLTDNNTSAPVITVTNAGTISAQDSGVTYTLYDSSDNVVESGNTTGEFTVSESGVYYVKAIAASTDYIDSAASTSVTATVPTYYIGGRFITQGWDDTPSTYKFTASTKTLYYLETGKTIAELSANITDNSGISSYSAAQIFYIIDDSGNYYTPGTASGAVDEGNFENCTSDNPLQLYSATSRYGSMLFTDANNTNSTTVTLWFDSSTNQLWYTAGVAYNITNGGATDSNGTISVADSAYSSSTVTVTATPNDGYILDTVTVIGATSGDEITTTVNSDNTATFTMPEENVTVTATFRKLETYTVTVSSADSTMGSVWSYYTAYGTSGYTQTVYEGDTITLGAQAKTDYAFSSWSISGSYTVSSGSVNSAEITIIPTSNITATANFEEDAGEATTMQLVFARNADSNEASPATWATSSYVHYSTVYKRATSGEGNYTSSDYAYEYYADIEVGDIDNNTSYNVYFGLTTDNDYTKIYWSSAVTVEANDPNNILSSYGAEGGWYSTKNYYFGRFNVSDLSAVTKFRVIVGYSDTESGEEVDSKMNYYCIVPIVDSAKANATIVTAYDGYNDDGVGNANYGDSTIATSDDITLKKSDTSYSSYYVQPETTFTVTTEVTSTDATNGWYVGAYSVDGVYYSATDLGSNKYSVTVTAGSDDIDIYPIYYNSNIDDDNNYITLYVDNWESVLLDSSTSTYASNVYAYPYYSTGTSSAAEYFGSYPGFKMTKTTTGKAVVKIPKYYYDSNGENQNYKIQGLTFGFNSTGSVQTYDYDDFVTISELENVDIIEFDVKYETAKYNKATTYSTTSSVSISNITLSDFGTDGNGWEHLTDYDGNNVDLYYNEVTDTSDAIYIVSSGNWYSSSSGISDSDRTIGKWSTMWSVYDSSGAYLGCGAPSDFIGEDTVDGSTKSTTASISNLYATVSGKTTYITYEKATTPNTNSTISESTSDYTRVDGRWVYTTSSSSFDAYTQAYYTTADSGYDSSDESAWSQETTGTTAGSATIAGMDYTNLTDNVYTYSFSDRTSEVTLSASPANGYVLYKWVMVTTDESGDTVFTDLTGTQATADNPVITMDSSYTIAALFIPLGETALSINHSMYTGTGANLGNGTFLVSASVIDSTGEAQGYSFSNATSGTLDLENIIGSISTADQYYIAITLTTTPSGMNTFNTWYQATDDGYAKIGPNDESDYDAVTATPTDYSGSTDTVTLTFYVDVYSLLNESESGLDVQNLNYFSDINKVTLNVTLNYNYADRFAEADEYGNYTPNKTYTVSATLDDTYIENGTINYEGTAFQTLVTENAPAIDDLLKTAEWVVTSYVQSSGAINLTAVQKDRTYTGQITYYDSDESTLVTGYYTAVYNGGAYASDGSQFTTAETYTDSEGTHTFSYWTVTNGTESILAYCYETTFSLRMTGNYTITPVYDADDAEEDKVAVGYPTYSVETYTSNGTPYSYVYADFLVSYYDTDGDKLKDNGNYISGIILVWDDVYEFEAVESSQSTAVVTTDSEGNVTSVTQATDIDLSKISSTYATQTLIETMIKGQTGKSISDDKTCYVYNYIIDSSDYNSNNRLDYYLGFKYSYDSTDETTSLYDVFESKDYNYYFVAYYYVYDVENETVYLSEPVYFELYNAAIQEVNFGE